MHRGPWCPYKSPELVFVVPVEFTPLTSCSKVSGVCLNVPALHVLSCSTVLPACSADDAVPEGNHFAFT